MLLDWKNYTFKKSKFLVFLIINLYKKVFDIFDYKINSLKLYEKNIIRVKKY